MTTRAATMPSTHLIFLLIATVLSLGWKRWAADPGLAFATPRFPWRGRARSRSALCIHSLLFAKIPQGRCRAFPSSTRSAGQWSRTVRLNAPPAGAGSQSCSFSTLGVPAWRYTLPLPQRARLYWHIARCDVTANCRRSNQQKTVSNKKKWDSRHQARVFSFHLPRALRCSAHSKNFHCMQRHSPARRATESLQLARRRHLVTSIYHRFLRPEIANHQIERPTGGRRQPVRFLVRAR